MTLIIAHRINTIEALKTVQPCFGVEIDIRSRGLDLILHHDPYAQGEYFSSWLDHFHHRTLILNVKEEGLEERILKLMKLHEISDFFFLDQSFPFLLKTARTGEKRCAVRVSEYESPDTALNLAGLVEWIWLDCFTRFPVTAVEAQILKKAGFKLCLVSPELQGRDPKTEIPALRKFLTQQSITIEAVCTKYQGLWS
ncbi:MAG: hypothetical protein LBT47_06310 [Deltaproteobacteria bacterium]|jgi:hypothetical protein|nr:hypothetical protein [Deltaproteobacteria bacterium]